MIIRDLENSDSIAELTLILNRSYAPLAEQGFRFVASYQDETITRKRLARGKCFVAVEDDKFIGTITAYKPEPDGLCEYYRKPGVWHFGQFAVEPTRQGHGLGVALLEHAEDWAKLHGASELALDTAEGAAQLISWYTKRGFEPKGFVQWPVTNYRSVVMSKLLDV